MNTLTKSEAAADKLTVKDIASYLPYDLKVQICEQPCMGQIETLSAIYKHGAVCLGEGGKFGFMERNFNQIKPILWPLEFLTKEITHNGEVITPIVLLANMSWGNIDWELGKDCAKNEPNGCHFKFHEGDMSFSCGDGNHWAVNNQSALFAKMDELHIDYRGLIGRGLGISKETTKKQDI